MNKSNLFDPADTVGFHVLRSLSNSQKAPEKMPKKLTLGREKLPAYFVSGFWADHILDAGIIATQPYDPKKIQPRDITLECRAIQLSGPNTGSCLIIPDALTERIETHLLPEEETMENHSQTTSFEFVHYDDSVGYYMPKSALTSRPSQACQEICRAGETVMVRKNRKSAHQVVPLTETEAENLPENLEKYSGEINVMETKSIASFDFKSQGPNDVVIFKSRSNPPMALIHARPASEIDDVFTQHVKSYVFHETESIENEPEAAVRKEDVATTPREAFNLATQNIPNLLKAARHAQGNPGEAEYLGEKLGGLWMKAVEEGPELDQVIQAHRNDQEIVALMAGMEPSEGDIVRFEVPSPYDEYGNILGHRVRNTCAELQQITDQVLKGDLGILSFQEGDQEHVVVITNEDSSLMLDPSNS